VPEGLGAPNGLLGLALTSAVLIAIPGPSIMFLVGQTLAVGRRNAWRGVIGNAIGMYGVAVIVALGIGSLVRHSEHALTVIRLLGALVLLGIGLHYLTSSPPQPVAGEARPRQYKRSLSAGIIIGATNPKALIMFGSIVPSFMADGIESPVLTLLGFSLIPIGLGLAIDAAWVAAAHSVKASGFLAGMGMRVLHLLGGGLMVLMALALAAESLR
jgi:threonine/homoserine/homoserine lactone efflux protein